MANKSITITNPYVIEYFEENYFDPNLILPVIIKEHKEKNKKLENQIDENTSRNDKIFITKEELKIFYEEYKFFINQKTTVTGIMKEAYRESQCNLNRIKFNNLDNFFTKHLNIKKTSFLCDICGIFTVSTKKGLITHKRKCLKDYEECIDDEDDENDEEYEEEDKQLIPEKVAEPIQKQLPQPAPQSKQVVQPVSQPKQTVQPAPQTKQTVQPTPQPKQIVQSVQQPKQTVQPTTQPKQVVQPLPQNTIKK
jgi:hypothetical protein